MCIMTTPNVYAKIMHLVRELQFWHPATLGWCGTQLYSLDILYALLRGNHREEEEGCVQRVLHWHRYKVGIKRSHL